MKRLKGMIPTPPVVSPELGKALDILMKPKGEDLEKLPKLRGKHRTVPKEKLPRPSIPMKIKLQVALRQLSMAFGGPGGEILQLDHDPALENRRFDPATGKYTPDANDPDFLVWRGEGDHDKKTHGPGGQKRITTKGGDNHTRDHREKMSKGHAAFEERMAAKGKPVVPRRER